MSDAGMREWPTEEFTEWLRRQEPSREFGVAGFHGWGGKEIMCVVASFLRERGAAQFHVAYTGVMLAPEMFVKFDPRTEAVSRRATEGWMTMGPVTAQEALADYGGARGRGGVDNVVVMG